MEPIEQLSVIIPMLEHVAGHIRDEQLDDPTPCSDFSVGDVLGHMTSLASGFAPMFRGVEPQDVTSAPGIAPVESFDRAMDELLAAVQSPGALDRTIQTPGGQMSGQIFARLVALDGLVHGWDLATATSQDWEPPESLVTDVDAFAREAISDDMRNGGAFGPPQTAPKGATTLQQLVAFTGRTW